MKKSVQITLIIALIACGNTAVRKYDKINSSQLLIASSFGIIEARQEHSTIIVKPEPMEKLLRLKWKSLVEVVGKKYSKSYTTPLVKNGIVFPGSPATHAFDAETGKKLHYKELSNQTFIQERLEDSLLFYSLDEEAIVFDVRSGDVLNKFRQNSYPRYSISPQLYNHKILPTIDTDKLKLVNILSGETMFTYQSSSEINGNFLVTNKDIFFSNEAGVYFMDFAGNLTDSIMVGKIDSRPVIDDEVIYFFIENYGLLAVDHNTKKLLWYEKNNWLDASLAFNKDTLFVNHGCLTAIDKKTGTIFWETEKASESCNYKYNQLIYCNGALLGLLEGYSSVDVVGAVSSKNGQLEYLYWKDGSAFETGSWKISESTHSEDDGVISIGPEFIFSEPYRDMIFAQYENLLVAFEIITP